MSCGCTPAPCGPIQPCEIENLGLEFPSLVGPQGPPGGPGTYVDNYDALRALDPTVFAEGYEVNVGGYATFNDGGTGVFMYAAGSAAADNDGTIIKPTTGPGAWFRVYNGPLYVDWFGAVGDGVTDDTAAIQQALDVAIGGALGFSPATYALFTELTYNSDAGAIDLIGNGATLLATGATNKDLRIYGTEGITINRVQVENLVFSSATSGASDAGLHVDGIAGWVVRDCRFVGGVLMTYGIRATGAQQAEVSGCTFRVVNGILAELSGGIGSNGIEIHGSTFGCSGTGLKLDRVDTASVHSNHFASNGTLQMDLTAEFAMINVWGNHIETLTPGNGVIVRNGYTNFSANSFLGYVGCKDLELVGTGESCKVIGNLIVANVVIGAGVTDTMFAFNSTGGTVTDGGTRTRNFGNRAFSGTPLAGSHLYDATIIESANVTGGAANPIATLRPTPGVSAHWGGLLEGAGVAKDIFLQYGAAGPSAGATTSGLSVGWSIKDAPGGTEWLNSRATFTKVPSVIMSGAPVANGAGEVSVGGTVGATVGAAGGAAALPATPAGYLTINVAGTNRVIPFYLP